MKHDIPLLKSDLDFKWLSPFHLLPRFRLAKKQLFNGNRNCNNFLNRAYMFLKFLYKNFYTYKCFLCYPSNSWLPFGKHKCILVYQEKCMVRLLFKNNMRHNVCNALRIYCLFLLQFLSVGGSLQKKHVLTSSVLWPTLNWTTACRDLQTPNRAQPQCIFCAQI